MTNKIIDFLDNPTSKLSKIMFLIFVILIYISIINAAIEEKYFEFFSEHSIYFVYLNNFILVIFSIELIVRIMFTKQIIKYFTSFYGIIDILAVVPELISIFVPGLNGAMWLRVFRLFRIIRILKVIRISKNIEGITGKLIPFIVIAIAFKGVMVIFEGQTWWPDTSKLNTTIAVVGFSLAVLLGTKLNVVNSRIYQIEDAICRIVGSLRDMQNNIKIKEELYSWSNHLEKTLKTPQEHKYETVKNMRQLTDDFEAKLEQAGVGGPNTAGFHRDVAYLLHRCTAETPASYERFLQAVTIAYTSTIILVVPGLTGLISTILIVYVLGGMYFLIDDMDHPLDYHDDSLIDVRLDALEMYNNSSH